MTNFTTFFRHDPCVVAALLNGRDSARLKGFAEADLQSATWLQSSIAVTPPNPRPADLTSEIVRKHNQVRLAYLIGWVLSIAASCVITYSFTAR